MKLTNKHFLILFFVCVCVLLIGIMFFGRPAQAQSILKGDSPYISQPRTSSSTTTTTEPSRTTGYIDGKYVNLKTVPQADGSTVTSGYVDGQYVRVKTRKP
jgi:hypothetical protein